LNNDDFNLSEAYFSPDGNKIWARLDEDGGLWG
jgi:hypothetical protein